jgi:hypothetical protein
MATRAELYTALRNADAAGDNEGAAKLAKYIQSMPADAKVPEINTDPSTGGGSLSFGPFDTEIKTPEWLDRGLAGAGKAFADTGRGLGQLVGAVSRDDVKASRAQDTSLMNTTAGKVGNFGGNVAVMIPTVAIPGAATLRGAALIGAAQGLAAPSESADETLKNIGLGGVAGAGGVAAGRVVSGVVQGGKALLEPFSQGGREKIAGRVIQRFADNPSSVLAAKGGTSITGAAPTIAEETADAGMARLQDSLRSVDPQIAGRIDARLSANNGARVSALQDLAGADGARDFHVAARSATADQLYDKARQIGIDPAALTPEAQANIAAFQQRIPQEVMDEAAKIAKIKGQTMGPEGSIDGLHWVKKGIDSLIKRESGPSGSTDMKAAYVGLKDDLMQGIGQLSPAYAEANATYQAMSKPINQMDIGQMLLHKGASNTSDLAGNVRLMPNSLTGLLKNEGRTVQQATGLNGVNKLSQVLTPEQENLVRTLVGEVDRSGAVARAGNGPGSATAQRMASQNVLSRLIGPTGLPSSWAESALANTVVGKPLNLLYGGVAEPKIQQALAEAVLDPAKAAQFLSASKAQGLKLPDNVMTQLLGQTARVTPSTLAVTRQR